MNEDSYNQGWKKLFAELNIQNRLEAVGRFDLSAKQIREIARQEARNMSKWDSREARPKMLRDAGVTILSTSRQGYTLIKGDGYESLPKSEQAVYHSPEKLKPFTTLSSWREKLTQESAAIDIAAISSILKTFTQEQNLFLTIRGRSGTPKFNFNFKGEDRLHNIVVDRAQIEIDAGFEGDKVWLVEAKIGGPEDFLIRQLFYPWRVWQALTKKPVIPVFLTYANKAFGLFRYSFVETDNYHSIKLLEKRWFTFDEPEGIPSLQNLFESSKPFTPNLEIPFPQADTLETVITVAELCGTTENTIEEISTKQAFDLRQGGYYTAAAEWLGFVQREKTQRVLTQSGQYFIKATRPQRYKIIFKAIAGTPVFRECIRRKLENIQANLDEISDMIEKVRPTNQTTSRRRAKTVQSWIAWLWREHENLSREAQ